MLLTMAWVGFGSAALPLLEPVSLGGGVLGSDMVRQGFLVVGDIDVIIVDIKSEFGLDTRDM
jgi:hypothetical protein